MSANLAPQPSSEAEGRAPLEGRAGVSRWLYSPLFVPLALLAMTLLMFADVLFIPGDRVISAPGFDIFTLMVYLRQFGFEQLRAGHIALWNPHVYCGEPFMGGFDPALFYAPNWMIYSLLPLAKAINFEVALHVFLLGLFMSLWVRRYGLHPLAILLASSIAMFGRPFFFATLFGHLPHLDSMAWAPLLLLAVDGLLDEPNAKWVLVGILALAMQVLAGYPQVLFDTLLACMVYGAIRLIKAPRPGVTVLAVSLVGMGAALITAAQLWTGLQAAAEGTRQGGVPFAEAARFSLRGVHLLILVIPNLLGTPAQWGGSILFFGVTGLAMALFGISVKSAHRGSWIAVALFMLLVGMGGVTPLYRLLYDFVPGFNRFRRPSAFSFEFMLFMAMLSAFGTDALLRSPRRSRIAATALLVCALALGGLGVLSRTGTSAMVNQAWKEWVNWIAAGRSLLYVAAAQHQGASQILIGAAMCAALAALFFLRAFGPGAACLVAVFGIAEVFLFAHSTVTTFSMAATVPAQVQHFIAAHPGDYRILNLDAVKVAPTLNFTTANSAIAIGADDIWGYDPMVPRRYSEFMYYAEGGNPDDADMIWNGTQRISHMFRLLRLRYVFVPQGNQVRVVEMRGSLPRLLLVSGWNRIQTRDQILAALSDKLFDPEKTVILESDPDPRPMPDGTGTALLMNSGTDWLEIAAETTRPALLLITDSYSRYWQAVPLSGSTQHRYQVMPADYTLMAIPLEAGHHLLRLQYAPSGWVIGRWVSLVASMLYLAVVGVYFFRRRQLLRGNVS